MFLKAINNAHVTSVFLVDFVPKHEEVLHPIDFLHGVYNCYLFDGIYTCVNELELQVIKRWLGDLYV